MDTITFSKFIEQVVFRSGTETETGVDVSNYADIQALANDRLEEVWNYTFWPFLLIVEQVNFTTESYRFVDISDGRRVLNVYDADPRETENAGIIRTDVLEADKLRLASGAPDSVWVQYLPAAPDYINDESPVVYRVFERPAVDMVYADLLEQEGQHGKSEVVLGRAYSVLEDRASRYAVMLRQPRVSVRKNVPRWGRWN